MPKLKHKVPSDRLHKPSGNAIVALDGQTFYLGRHGTQASIAEYDRLVGAWQANGRRLPPPRDAHAGPFVTELIAAYWRFAQDYYDGAPKELNKIQTICKSLRRMYGRDLTADFGPLELKTIRQTMIDENWSRSHINDQTTRLKRIFKWGAENRLVPGSVAQDLWAVSGLRRGRSKARETEPVRPVADEHVEAIKPFVSRQVWAIIKLQQLAGCRPGEAVIMRGCDIDMNDDGDLWEYRPTKHKGQHRGHDRVISLGPKARAVVKPFLRTGYLFSPADADRERREQLHKKRKTPISCGNKPGSNRKRSPKHKPGERYTTDTYRRAITRGCDLADREARKRNPKAKRDTRRSVATLCTNQSAGNETQKPSGTHALFHGGTRINSATVPRPESVASLVLRPHRPRLGITRSTRRKSTPSETTK